MYTMNLHMFCVTCDKKLKIQRDLRKHLGHTVTNDKSMGATMKNKKMNDIGYCEEHKEPKAVCDCKPQTNTPWSAELLKNETYRIQALSHLSEVIATGLNQADAAFIVRAVNAHEELLEATKTAFRFFTTEANTPDENGMSVAPDSMVRVVLRKMHQAIAKAEGK